VAKSDRDLATMIDSDSVVREYLTVPLRPTEILSPSHASWDALNWQNKRDRLRADDL